MAKARIAKFQIGQIVRHRIYPFRGVIFDIDPEFNNTDEWYESIPEDRRPRKDQPFYHLFAENAESEYIAYVSEQNLLPDTSGEPVRHPQVAEVFEKDEVRRLSPAQRRSQLEQDELSLNRFLIPFAPRKRGPSSLASAPPTSKMSTQSFSAVVPAQAG